MFILNSVKKLAKSSVRQNDFRLPYSWLNSRVPKSSDITNSNLKIYIY